MGRFPSGVLAPRLSQHIQERGGSAPSLSESESQKEECHPGEDIFNASFHNDIKITIITWDSPNTANIVPFGVAEEEVLNSKSHPGEIIVNA